MQRAYRSSTRKWKICLRIVWPHAKHAAHEKDRCLSVQKTHRKDRMDCCMWNPKSGTPTELLSPNLKSKPVVLHCHHDVRIKPFVRLNRRPNLQQQERSAVCFRRLKVPSNSSRQYLFGGKCPFSTMLEFLSRCNGTMAVLYDLVCKLENIGLSLKAAKRVVLTSEFQPPSFLHASNGGRYTNMINGAGSRNTH